MTQQFSLAEKQGYYRYDPNSLISKGASRLFPYTGQDGSTRYVLSKLYEIIRLQGRLSVPCSLLLTEIESTITKLESKWQDLSTILVDLRFLQSDWWNFDLPPNEQLNNDYVQEKRKFLLKIWLASAVAQVLNRNLPESDQIQQQRQLFLHSLAKSFFPTPLPTRSPRFMNGMEV